MSKDKMEQALFVGIYNKLKADLKRTPTVQEVQDAYNGHYGTTERQEQSGVIYE